MQNTRTIRTAALASAAVVLMAACDGSTPLATENHDASSHGVALNSALADANPQLAQQLSELKQLTAKYHNFKQAQQDYPALVSAPPLTAPDGCVSDMTQGGMGYHYAGLFGIDDHVNYLEPDLLVYAPKNGAQTSPDGEPRFRLAAFDYFIPYSDVWPEAGPAPTSVDLGLAIDPAIAFAPSRFGGWMFHIWLWEHNPAGMFSNWNPAVPLCAGSTF